jgi:diguanylate cyclase (GGDEF)-like protein
MQPAKLPDNESERLRYLREMGILDTPLEERFERITRMVCRTLGVPMAAVSLVDADRQWFKSAQGLQASETSREVAFCAHAILDDQPFIVPDTHRDGRFSDNPLVTDNPQIRFYAGIPLRMAPDICIGTLCAIDSKPRELSPEELEALEDLSEMVKTELAAARLSEEHAKLISKLQSAQRAALIDPLTRLWNRAGGERLLEREWASSNRRERAMSVAVVDVDRFKSINDTHGHAAGDAALKHFATNLMKGFRATDVIARWGGDEFIIVLPDCGRDVLRATLQRLNARLGRKPLVHASCKLGLTASIGAWSGVPGAEMDAQVGLQAADEALYRAKRQGRDQFVIAD